VIREPSAADQVNLVNPPMPLSVGDKLGPYEIVAPLGAGGMGEVYKARDTRLDRVVAIKVSKEKFSDRFTREARSIAALNHPHICQLYDVGPDYLVMEYIEGAPLKGPLDQAMKYAGQICDAPDAAHRKGITHRDLKPANIMVSKAGVKLLSSLEQCFDRSEPLHSAFFSDPAYLHQNPKKELGWKCCNYDRRDEAFAEPDFESTACACTHSSPRSRSP